MAILGSFLAMRTLDEELIGLVYCADIAHPQGLLNSIFKYNSKTNLRIKFTVLWRGKAAVEMTKCGGWVREGGS